MGRSDWGPQECICSWRDLDALPTFQRRWEIPARPQQRKQNNFCRCCWKNLVRARSGYPQRARIIPFQSKSLGKGPETALAVTHGSGTPTDATGDVRALRQL